MRYRNSTLAQRAFATGRHLRRQIAYTQGQVCSLADERGRNPDEYARAQVETNDRRVGAHGERVVRQGGKRAVQAWRNLFRRRRAQQSMRMGRSVISCLGKLAMATMKTAAVGAKALATAVFAGGWIAVLVVIVVSLVAGILLSPMGIFFSGKSNEKGQTIPQVVREINGEYQSKIEELCDAPR